MRIGCLRRRFGFLLICGLIPGCPTTVVVHQPPLHIPNSLSEFHAGAAQVDITPPPGLPLFGYSMVGAPFALGYRTRLKARALVLQSKKSRIAIVQVDLGAVSILLYRMVASQLADLGLGPADILLGATHTHAGPGGYFGHHFYNAFGSGRSGYDPEVLQWLSERIVQSIRKAVASLAPALVAVGSTRIEDVSLNRSKDAWKKNPGVSGYDAVDRNLYLIRVDKKPEKNLEQKNSQPIAAFAVFAIHGTSVSANNRLYHGDLYAATSTALAGCISRKYGVSPSTFVAALLNGASGDVRPSETCKNYSAAWRLGKKIAAPTCQLFENLLPELTDQVLLSRKYREVRLPDAMTSSGKVCKRPELGKPMLGGSEEGRSGLEAIFKEGSPKELPQGCHGAKEKALGEFQNVIVRPEHFPRSINLQIIRIGNLLTLATVPGEPTSEVGRNIQKAMLQHEATKHVAVVGLSNGYTSYFTTKAEYDEQHYEGGSTLYGPHQSQLVIDTLGSLSKKLAANNPNPAPIETAFFPGPAVSFLGCRRGCSPSAWKVTSTKVKRTTSGTIFRVSVSWKGMPWGADCRTIPHVAINCDGSPLMAPEGVLEDDSLYRMEVTQRYLTNLWEAKWWPPPEFSKRNCQLRIERPGMSPLRSQIFNPLSL